MGSQASQVIGKVEKVLIISLISHIKQVVIGILFQMVHDKRGSPILAVMLPVISVLQFMSMVYDTKIFGWNQDVLAWCSPVLVALRGGGDQYSWGVYQILFFSGGTVTLLLGMAYAYVGRQFVKRAISHLWLVKILRILTSLSKMAYIPILSIFILSWGDLTALLGADVDKTLSYIFRAYSIMVVIVLMPIYMLTIWTYHESNPTSYDIDAMCIGDANLHLGIIKTLIAVAFSPIFSSEILFLDIFRALFFIICISSYMLHVLLKLPYYRLRMNQFVVGLFSSILLPIVLGLCILFYPSIAFAATIASICVIPPVFVIGWWVTYYRYKSLETKFMNWSENEWMPLFGEKYLLTQPSDGSDASPEGVSDANFLFRKNVGQTAKPLLLRFQSDVEVATRFLRDNSWNLRQKWRPKTAEASRRREMIMEAVDRWYQAALESFSVEDSYINLCYANFLKYYRRRTGESIAVLKRINFVRSSFAIRFRVFVHQREDELSDTALELAEDKIGTMRWLEFHSLIGDVHKLRMATFESELEFWNQLQTSYDTTENQLDLTTRAAVKANKCKVNCMAAYETIIERFPFSHYLLRDFASFLLIAANDEALATQYLHRADTLESEQSRMMMDNLSDRSISMQGSQAGDNQVIPSITVGDVAVARSSSRPPSPTVSAREDSWFPQPFPRAASPSPSADRADGEKEKHVRGRSPPPLPYETRRAAMATATPRVTDEVTSTRSGTSTKFGAKRDAIAKYKRIVTNTITQKDLKSLLRLVFVSLVLLLLVVLIVLCCAITTSLLLVQAHTELSMVGNRTELVGLLSMQTTNLQHNIFNSEHHDMLATSIDALARISKELHEVNYALKKSLLKLPVETSVTMKAFNASVGSFPLYDVDMAHATSMLVSAANTILAQPITTLNTSQFWMSSHPLFISANSKVVMDSMLHEMNEYTHVTRVWSVIALAIVVFVVLAAGGGTVLLAKKTLTPSLIDYDRTRANALEMLYVIPRAVVSDNVAKLHNVIQKEEAERRGIAVSDHGDSDVDEDQRIVQADESAQNPDGREEDYATAEETSAFIHRLQADADDHNHEDVPARSSDLSNTNTNVDSPMNAVRFSEPSIRESLSLGRPPRIPLLSAPSGTDLEEGQGKERETAQENAAKEYQAKNKIQTRERNIGSGLLKSILQWFYFILAFSMVVIVLMVVAGSIVDVPLVTSLPFVTHSAHTLGEMAESVQYAQNLVDTTLSPSHHQGSSTLDILSQTKAALIDSISHLESAYLAHVHGSNSSISPPTELTSYWFDPVFCIGNDGRSVSTCSTKQSLDTLLSHLIRQLKEITNSDFTPPLSKTSTQYMIVEYVVRLAMDVMAPSMEQSVKILSVVDRSASATIWAIAGAFFGVWVMVMVVAILVVLQSRYRRLNDERIALEVLLSSIPVDQFSKPLLSWGSSYCVGVQSIDEQHKHLIRLINSLYRGMMLQQTRSVVSDVMDSLVEFVFVHFSHEETMFKKYDYPHTLDHISKHHILAGKVFELLENYKQRELQSGISEVALVDMEMLAFLKRWFLLHIAVDDRRASAYFNSIGIH